ncbi:hypothetical protein ACTHOQ_16330 [Solibacillus silvestris]|uniref:hypothetical protein n=1 Tax=Solibacillus silvestris TaxID=76853 RepID=UPI003F813A28
MSRYTIIITSKDCRRLHFRTNNETLILFMYECFTRSLNVPVAQSLTLEEMIIVDAYLDDPQCCEINDSLTNQSLQLPV